MRLIKVSESSAAKRRVYFQITAADGVTPALAEATGQPQICTNGVGGFTNTGVGTLTHIGNGRYYAELTTGAVATVGDEIETRYKSASTAETPGDSAIVVAFDPYGTGAAAGGVANPGATGGMTLAQARKWIRHFARDAAGSNSEYEDEDIDFALQAVGEQFCRVTKCTRRVSSIALTPDSSSVDVSALAGFHPERVLSARVGGTAGQLERPGYTELNRRLIEDEETGVPTAVAFEDSTTGDVHPIPDIAYTLKVDWWEPFTTWTPGVDETTADTIVLNLRPDYLLQILPDGPTSMLQHTEPKMRYASDSWQRYLLVEKKLTGAGSLGARTTRRDMAQF